MELGGTWKSCQKHTWQPQKQNLTTIKNPTHVGSKNAKSVRRDVWYLLVRARFWLRKVRKKEKQEKQEKSKSQKVEKRWFLQSLRFLPFVFRKKNRKIRKIRKVRK